jgi:hypothetical protein
MPRLNWLRQYNLKPRSRFDQQQTAGEAEIREQYEAIAADFGLTLAWQPQP